MVKLSVNEFLAKKYGAENVTFLGHGSDSVAMRVGDHVFRFTNKGIHIYSREADICNILRPHITAEIPNIKIHKTGGLFFAEHKMIVGEKWSWHKFQFSPRRQRNLANTCAEFLAELHGVDTNTAIAAVPDLNSGIPYVDFDDVEPFLAEFMGPRMLRFFRRHYGAIISRPVAKSDMVIVHMGLKGANSVCFPDGRLRGVYDFGNCGIYERGRDFVLFALSRNSRLYNGVLRRYRELTGVNIDKKRIKDLSSIEFLWKKRWVVDGKMVMMKRHFLKKQLATALLHFCGLPTFGLRPLVYWELAAHERAYARHHRD